VAELASKGNMTGRDSTKDRNLMLEPCMSRELVIGRRKGRLQYIMCRLYRAGVMTEIGNDPKNLSSRFESWFSNGWRNSLLPQQNYVYIFKFLCYTKFRIL